MKNIAYFFLTAIAIVTVLIFGKSLLIPFVFALLLWFTIRKVRLYIDRVEFISKIPSWVKNILISMGMITVIVIFSHIITSQINTLAKSYPKYEKNVELLISKANESLNIDLESIAERNMGDFDFGEILKSIFNSLTEILSNTFMIIIYVVFIFLEEAYFSRKLRKAYFHNEHSQKLDDIMSSIETSIAKYLGLKTLISTIACVTSYFAFLFIGIDSPVFWAFLIFILNYLPVVGPLLGALMPSIFCLLQFGDFAMGGIVLGVVGGIQLIVGNVLEPKLMGDSMNLSPLVTILALAFWGAIWGVTGMILSIPITVIMIISFSHFKSTRSIAIMLSQKGRV